LHSRRAHGLIALIVVRTLPILALLGLALVPGTALAAPANDEYTGAQSLALNTPASGSNVDATAAGDPQPCGGVTIDATIWYRVPGTGGPVTLNTSGSAVDTVLAVYDTDGSATPDNGPPSNGNAIACNNDIWPGGNEQDDRASEVVFDTVDGLDYLVQIGTCSGCGSALAPTGEIDLIAFTPPPNDDRAAARTLTAGQGVLADNVGATTESGERAECGTDHEYGKTVWFRFSTAQSGSAVFTTGGNLDAVMAVYQGGTRLGCNDDGVPGAVGPSRLALRLAPGEYLVQVGGWGGGIRSGYGPFSMQVDFTPDRPPPASDRDGDGIPDATDRCPDQSSRARDADADGCLDPPQLKTLRTTLSVFFIPKRRFTRVQQLAVNALPAGATVKVTCKAKPRRRCPYTSRSYKIRKVTRSKNLRKPFRRKKLPPRATITIQVTAPGYEGKVWRYRMRRGGKKPTLKQLCLPAGATRPQRCVP
jgi:hypothetical protein